MLNLILRRPVLLSDLVLSVIIVTSSWFKQLCLRRTSPASETFSDSYKRRNRTKYRITRPKRGLISSGNLYLQIQNCLPRRQACILYSSAPCLSNATGLVRGWFPLTSGNQLFGRLLLQKQSSGGPPLRSIFFSGWLELERETYLSVFSAIWIHGYPLGIRSPERASARPIITQTCRKSSMSCARPSSASPTSPPQMARSTGRARLRQSVAINIENAMSAGSPSVAAMLIGVQCASKGTPRYSPGLVPNPLPRRGCRASVASDVEAARKRLESTL